MRTRSLQSEASSLILLSVSGVGKMYALTPCITEGYTINAKTLCLSPPLGRRHSRLYMIDKYSPFLYKVLPHRSYLSP